jgi:serine/threonine-protein kinase
MGRIRHPNVASVWDYEDNSACTYFVMEYFCLNLGAMIGETYDLEAPSRLLGPDRAVHYTRQLLAGLARLHQAGIVHRDVKPYNLLITDDDVVKITDFGLSRLRGESTAGPRRLKVGSPYYAAPEQERDPDAATPQSDLYSVGVTLHRLLTGKLVYQPGAIDHDLDDCFRDFSAKALNPKPRDRFASAGEMLAALDKAASSWSDTIDAFCRLEPHPAPGPRPDGRPVDPLRRDPRTVDHQQAADFFNLDELGRPLSYQQPDFSPREDGTVLDKNTGLIWQQAGSDFGMTWPEARDYVAELNRRHWSGSAAWRLPTVHELLSVLRPPAQDEDYCVAPVFDQGKKWLWTADRRSATAAWYVNTDLGFVDRQDATCHFYVRAVR